MSLVIVHSERFAEHQTPPGHPERPERAEVMDVVASRWRERDTEVVAPPEATRASGLTSSPEIDSISSLTPDNHGGNMDLPDMGPGSVTYLPVRSPGARVFIGDAHACQGDGEVCGVAVEYATVTTIRVDLVKGWNIEWPRLENDEVIMTIGSARPLDTSS